ncbi:class D beta-lactamase [Portibacter marinus]|uniref:class D beta-lactamase n=1 Tax=Portibacter marinus TaxID=2898660 RepID=UPI001EFF4D14|nr:class D beta-lactamase [Portibacter marinus]
MKIPSLLFLSVWFYDFSTQITQKPIDITHERRAAPVFQAILDSAQVRGSILIYDLKRDIYHSNDFERAETAFIPASTFKIPNSLIALETEVIKDEYFIFEWDGIERSVENWNQDLTFKQAFHYSCVPCFQRIADQVGAERMQKYVESLKFGQMEVTQESLTTFWLMGDSEISSLEQIAFLKRLYSGELPISKRTEEIAKRMMVSEAGDHYSMISKTGWSSNGILWYVGYLEMGDEAYFFATNLDHRVGMDLGVRIHATKQALHIIAGLPYIKS